MSQVRAATRSARAVFLCAEPGDQLAIFGEATYFHKESGRYWFSTQPTLNRLAEDRATAPPEHDVDSEIIKQLAEDGKTKGGFHRVFAAPDDPTAIDEAQTMPLVMLGPSAPHSGKGAAKWPATEAAYE